MLLEAPDGNGHGPTQLNACLSSLCVSEDILPSSKTKTGGTAVIYDDRMLLHKKYKGAHIERPERLIAIRKELTERGITDLIQTLESRDATFEELAYVHTKRHIRKLLALQNSSPSDVECHQFAIEEYEDMYMNKSSVSAALLAAGSSVIAVEAVIKGKVRNGFALVRPPGHHAESHCGMGFCLFNNVAIAAKAAVNDLGVKKVLIVDWDVHHGNGTQRCFINDENVMYFSVHRHDNGRFYPHGESSAAETVGIGNGVGRTVNVALNGKGYGDDDFLAVWEHVLLPIGKEFAPEIVIVSAGFDAALGDTTGGCKVTPGGYAKLIRGLKGLTNGKVVAILEGGYHIKSLSESVAACIEELQRDDDCNSYKYDKQRILPGTTTAINSTIRAHKVHWKSIVEI
mmetsp:Transcript_8093/g.9747  ORF Transcript_8093/g.9747 Transcript_8093/m.9747 type:complete len:400 (-) Transcript_8093:1428-2627(-)